MKTSLFKKIRHLLEGLIAGFMFVLFYYILPFKACVAFWGWIARTVGPRLSLSKRARSNLKKCFPEMPNSEIQKTIVEMWDNFGRLMAEYLKPQVFWDGKSLHKIEVIGIENLKQFQEDGKPGILFTAHLGNWQMISLAAQSIGFDLTQMYRPPNNPWMDALMLKCQKGTVKNVITKGRGGPKEFLSLIKRGDHALLLVDQKMGEGIAVPFLGHKAMTATGIAKMYLNQNCPLLPARSERLYDSHFRVTFYPPIKFVSQGDQQEDMYNLLLEINTMIGQWITERPGQWLWLHRRWHNS
ncbi:MAG: lauroyl acyltransferase [Proteobacteria bacterium]|nr:lauroyl acyltransferase [Pseudomonadota bacterium]